MSYPSRVSLRMLGADGHRPVLFCVECDLPILVYGRMVNFLVMFFFFWWWWAKTYCLSLLGYAQKPCLHFLCVKCANEQGKCSICQSIATDVDVIHVEETQREQLYFSPDACLFLADEREEFKRHIHDTIHNNPDLRFHDLADELHRRRQDEQHRQGQPGDAHRQGQQGDAYREQQGDAYRERQLADPSHGAHGSHGNRYQGNGASSTATSLAAQSATTQIH